MIKAPNWAPYATPSTRGWHGKNGELLKSQALTQEQVNEWNNANTVMLTEAPVSKPLESMTATERALVENQYELDNDVKTLNEDQPKKSWWSR